MEKEMYEIARLALIRLFQDSLELNDRNEPGEAKDAAEEAIMEDFNTVADYLQYLRLMVEKYEPTQKEDAGETKTNDH